MNRTGNWKLRERDGRRKLEREFKVNHEVVSAGFGGKRLEYINIPQNNARLQILSHTKYGLSPVQSLDILQRFKTTKQCPYGVGLDCFELESGIRCLITPNSGAMWSADNVLVHRLVANVVCLTSEIALKSMLNIRNFKSCFESFSLCNSISIKSIKTVQFNGRGGVYGFCWKEKQRADSIGIGIRTIMVHSNRFNRYVQILIDIFKLKDKVLIISEPQTIGTYQEMLVKNNFKYSKRKKCMVWKSGKFKKKIRRYCRHSVCGRVANGRYKCCGCRVVKYCSRKCQKKDWKLNHRNVCSTINKSLF